MIKMRPYVPSERIAVRADSIDEECSDDIEDDVFIRDNRSGKLSEENGLKRPLMAPRHRNKTNNGKLNTIIPIMKKNRRKFWRCCEPFCYGLAAVTILMVLIFLAALVLTLFPIPLQKLKIWLKKEPQLQYNIMDKLVSNAEYVPCTQITVQNVWKKIFPRMNSESPVRKADLNGDGIMDIIFGYGIDDSVQYEGIQLPKCTSSRDEEVLCEGGLITLNGKTGDLIWQTWTAANIFSILCNFDIDKDNYMDCIASGRGGIVIAINGRNGNIIWSLKEMDAETNSPIIINLYTINTIRDLDGDGCPEIFAVHLEERKTSQASHIKLISGRTGKVIRSLPTPFREEVFVPMQLLTQQDGTEQILILTGGQNSPGGIYTIRLHTLMEYRSEKEFNPIYQISFSGFMSPAILVDITGDLIDDIIVTSFNSTVYAFDGKNYSMIWNYTFPLSESVSSIVPGHFNNDNITDFMVKYNTGPGFPVYYYSQTTILNGVDGHPLMSSMMVDSGGPNSLLGGVSISQTFGGDFFLHWQVQCRDKYEPKDPYEFVPDSDAILQARADTCVLRYNTSTVLKLYAIARHVEPPGAVIFSSDDIGIKLNRTQPNTKKKQESISPLKHPKMLKKLLANKEKKPSNEEQLLFNPNPQVAPKNLIKTNSEGRIPQHRKKPNIFKPAKNINDDETLVVEPQFPITKPYFYSAFNNFPEKEFLQKEYENELPLSQQRNSDLYNEEPADSQDLIYTDEQQEPIPPQLSNRPIHMRSKYPSNRDIRSDIIFVDSIENVTINLEELSLSKGESTTPTYYYKTTKNEPLNLWDLEMEKEEEEANKESNKFDSNRQKRDFSEDNTKEQNDFFLASISSSGVLVNTLDKNETSSIDYVFVVNVRESETYPPLFLPQDLNCVEEKMSAYKATSADDLLILQKQILNQCLKTRLNNVDPVVPRYESQIVVVRISISCTCNNNLQQKEVCSKFQSINQQRWTEFMGNAQNGIYRN